MARFATDGAVNLRLKAKHEGLGRPVARMAGRDLASNLVQDGTLQFVLPGPGQYYVQLPALAGSNSTFAVCVDRDTGKVVHDLKVFDTEKPAHVASVNSYASPTPVIEAGRVYVHYGTYGTACLDTKTGAILWTRRDLNCDHHEGPGASPMLHGKMSETKNPPAVRTTSSASTRLKPPRIVFMASLCTPIDAFSILTPRA